MMILRLLANNLGFCATREETADVVSAAELHHLRRLCFKHPLALDSERLSVRDDRRLGLGRIASDCGLADIADAQTCEGQMIKFIYVLYCVVGCEQSLPSHRIIYAFDTIERCQRVKENVEAAISGRTHSCEKVSFEQDK
jgi:hypothetical protein